MFSDQRNIIQKGNQKVSNCYKLSNITSNPWVKEKITIEIRKYFQQMDNEDTAYKQLWKIAKTMPSVEFIALNTCIRKELRLKIYDLSFYQDAQKKKKKKMLRNIQQTKEKKQKKITKIRKLKEKKMHGRAYQQKRWFFENME